MMKSIFFLASILGNAIAFQDTCVDIAFDSKTNVLSARCQPRDNSGYVPTGLDLNKCFGYDGEKLRTEYQYRNYSDSCNNCRIFLAPDPWYGFNNYWLGCDCEGSAEEATVCITVAAAHQWVHNENGVLTC
ncbi:hypothetical protein FLONG3_2114 [Fusarium longipes]|uniref:Cyanovirin-N domain-containing protein n=1 Tax=Fusarium longipes TaxID=694270 RepID=A0A395T555_9HYPO|nr:hypothetical protein FLONG3_2114 [Fusarium longipes]